MRSRSLMSKLKNLSSAIISATACVGASNLITFSYAGSTYGFSLLWVTLIILILSIFILQIAAQVGMLTKRGLISNIRQHFGNLYAVIVSSSIAISNQASVVAEIVGASVILSVLIGFSPEVWAPLISLAICFIAVKEKSSFLKSVLVSLSFAILIYLVAAYMSNPPIHDLINGLISIKVGYSRDLLLTMMAMLGTSITAHTLLFEVSEAARKVKEFRDLVDEYNGAVIGSIISCLVNIAALITCASLLYPTGARIIAVEDLMISLSKLLGSSIIIPISIGMLASAFLASSVIALSNFKLLDELIEDLADLLKIRAAVLSGWKIILSSLTLLMAPLLLFAGFSPLKLIIHASAISFLFMPISLFSIPMILGRINYPSEVRVNILRFSCWFIVLSITFVCVASLILSIV